MAGHVQLMVNGREIPGPYLQSAREEWLKNLLSAQTFIRNNAPPEVRDLELVTMQELQEIRRIWVIDKHELEDSLPRIYKEATGQDYPGKPLDDNLVMGELEMNNLLEICGDDRLHYELTRELLSITRQQRSLSRRSGLFEQLEKAFRRHYYDDREDALNRARNMADERKKIAADRLAIIPSVLEQETNYEKEPEA
jgi:DNA sulfur modification protein DndC